MNREANTILSKTTDLELSNCGIELKTLIEKVREQTANGRTNAYRSKISNAS